MPLRQNTIKILSLSSVVILAACGYAVEKSNQTVKIITPGAENARCDVWVDKIRYQINPPQKMNIMKSENDMKLDCMAPGNRRITMTVAPSLETKAIWGTPAGMAWDYASKSLFHYPDVIAVDFSQEAIVPNDLPKHNSPDIKQPEEYDLEEFRPAAPRMNSDKNKEPAKIWRRGEREQMMQEQNMSDDSAVEAQDKGSLETILERLGTGETTEATPSKNSGGTAIVPPVDSGEAVSGPTPLFAE